MNHATAERYRACCCLWSGVGIELAQGGFNMWACVNLLAGCKYIISHNQRAVWCTRCGGSCRWSGTSPVQIYTVGGRWRRDKDTKFCCLGESQTGWSSAAFNHKSQDFQWSKSCFPQCWNYPLRGSFAQWSMMSASQPAFIGQVANSEGNRVRVRVRVNPNQYKKNERTKASQSPPGGRVSHQRASCH